MPDSDFSEEHLAILRAMTPEQKLDAAFRLYWTARDLKAAGLRMAHPEWTEAQVQEEVRRIFFMHDPDLALLFLLPLNRLGARLQTSARCPSDAQNVERSDRSVRVGGHAQATRPDGTVGGGAILLARR